jgi:hypothetical protein
MKTVRHWQDPVNAAIGAALILSPWAARFDSEMAATTNAIVVGMALLAAALGAMMAPKAWEEWTEAVLGLWMIMSPWLLSFSNHSGATITAVVTGTVVVLLSLWTIATDRNYSLPKAMLP